MIVVSHLYGGDLSVFFSDIDYLGCSISIQESLSVKRG